MSQGSSKVAALYAKFGPIIYARCHRMLRDAAAAEDATQEVFMRVLRHADALPDDRAMLSWICRIASNYCINVVRDGARFVDAGDEVFERPGEHPEPALASRELVGQVLARAPAKMREVAVLHYLEDVPQGRVAEELGIARRTVINRLEEFLDRSRKYLRRAEPAIT